MPALLAIALALQVSAPPRTPPAPPPPPPMAPADAVQPTPLRGAWPAHPSGKRVTLAASLTVNDALTRIAEAAGWNAVLDTGPTGARTVVLKLRNVPVEEALRAALSGTGLAATRTGDTVVVAEAAGAAGAAPILSGFDRPSGKRFSGDFDDEEVADALRKLARAGDLSIVLPPGELGGSVNASFKDVPVEDALRAVLAQGNLTARREGALLVVRRAGAPGGGLSELGDAVRRTTEQALQRAGEAMQAAQDRRGEQLDRAQEQMDRAEEKARARAEKARERAERQKERTRDREVTGSDLTVSPGEDVRDVSVVRGSIRLQSGASARDTTAVSGSVTLDPGAEARDVVAILGSTTLDSGASARQVVAVFGDVTLQPGAEVTQDVTSIGGRLIIDPAAQVGGGTHAISLPQLPNLVGLSMGNLFAGATSPWVRIAKVLGWFAVLFGLGLLASWMMPRRYEVVSNLIASDPLPSILAGLLGLLGAVILSILLAITVVGALLVPVLILAVIAGGLLGLAALGLRIGQSIPLPSARRNPVLQLALGTLIFVVLAELPVIGWMIWVAATLLAVGAALRTRFGQRGPAVLPTAPLPPAGA